MFSPTTISALPSPTPSSSSSTPPLSRNVPVDHPLTVKDSSSSRSPPPPKLPPKNPSKITKRLPQPVSLPKHEPEPREGALPKLSQKIIYEKSSEGSVDDPERFRSRYVRKKKKPSSSSSSGSASASLSSSSSSLPTPPRAARCDEGEFQPLPKSPDLSASCPEAAAAAAAASASYPDPLPQTNSPAPHIPNSVSMSILPQYIQNIIYHSQHAPPKPQHDAKLLKKLSKSILLPEDPADPTAFTVTPGLTRPPKAPWCSSKPVVKIVGTFAILMSLGIIIAIVYVNCEYLLSKKGSLGDDSGSFNATSVNRTITHLDN